MMERVGAYFSRKVYKDKTCLKHDEGFTVIELLISIFIFALIIGLTVTMFLSFYSSFNTSISEAKSQLQAETSINVISSLARSASECPGSSSSIVNTTTSGGSTVGIEFAAPIPSYSYVDNSVTPSVTTNVVIFSVQLSGTTLTAKAFKCNSPSTPFRDVEDATDVTNFKIVFQLLNVSSGNVTTSLPLPTANTVSPSQYPYVAGLTFNVTISVLGSIINISNYAFINNVFCNSNSGLNAPIGSGGCVV